jgi:two-component system sensor histidine kinase HydH
MTEYPAEIFRRCVDDSSEAIMLTNPAGVLIYVNKAWCKIYGYAESEAIGRTPRLLRSRHQTKDTYETMWQEILNPEIGFWRGELINQARDGREVPVLLTITPYRAENNQIAGYMGLALDLTARKALESEILQQDRLATVGYLASGLAHEVGTPLGVIRGRAEMLATKADPTTRGSLDIIVAQIDRISRLIYSLLNVARADQSGVSQWIHPYESAENIRVLLNQQFEKHKITFKNELSPELRVLAASDQLGQILLNLTINAVHGIQDLPEGRVRQISIRQEDQESGVRLLIRDSGCGIPAENLKRIFKPFFTTKPVGQGTGLGLAICSRIMESWGGTITVQSTVGEGTTFFLEFKNPPKTNSKTNS